MAQLRCPRCSNLVQVAAGPTPVCPVCGFSAASAPAQAVPAYSPWAVRPPAGPVAGKPRSFGVSLLLVVVTFGIYGWIWNYKAFRELDKEHGWEYEEIWFWLGVFVSNVFLAVYHVKEIGKLVRFRHSRSMSSGITPVAFVVFVYVIPIALGILGLILVLTAIQSRPINPAPIVAALALDLLAFGPTIYAFFRLSHAINEVWASVYRQKGLPWPKGAGPAP